MRTYLMVGLTLALGLLFLAPHLLAQTFVFPEKGQTPEQQEHLTPLKISYEAAKKRAEPYNKIVGELPEMRRDTVELVRRAVTETRNAYVLVNNRAEGNAPLTVEALVDQLRG
jgi:hypothetical protein